MKLFLAFVLSVISVFATADIDSEVKTTVELNLKNCADENLSGMMNTLHSQSPSYLPTQQAMRQLFPAYDLKYTLVSYSFVGSDSEYAYAKVKQKVEKIRGPAFQNNELEALQVFKKEGGSWKLWTQANLSIKYL